MASYIDDLKRNMLPLWRSYGDSVKSRELDFTGRVSLPVRFDSLEDIEDVWKFKHSIVTAADLLNVAVVSDNTEHIEVKKAAEFLISHSDECSPLALDIANSIIEPKNKPIVDVSLTSKKSFNETAKELINGLQKQEDKTKACIGLLRKQVHEHCYNPIAYCELARCYANLGMDQKAEKFMDYAVYLGPNSRYISRCAVRFYTHIRKYDKAKRVLINNGLLKSDPWIMSAEIAVESVIGKTSRYIKVGRQLVLSGNVSSYSSSELCFAICIEDRKSGSRKDAKKMYEKGIVDPNDNSLAQAEFFAKEDSNIKLDISSYHNVSHKNEADTRKAFGQGKYQEAFISSLKWMHDYRFEHRPIEFAFNISCVYLKQYDMAIDVVDRFLASNPTDASAINNIVYALGLSDRIEEAEERLNSVNLKRYLSENSTTAICLAATCGLLEYRKGNIQEGRELYNLSIDAANKQKLKDLAAKARLNMIREEVRAVDNYDKSMLNEMNSLNAGSVAETEQLKKDILEEVEKKKHK